MQHWSRWGLPVASTNVADWGDAPQQSQLVETKRGDWDCPGWRWWRSGVSPTIGASPPTPPRRGGGIPSQCQCGRWPSAPTNVKITLITIVVWRSRALPLEHLRLDRVASLTCGNAILVGELTRVPNIKDYQEFAQKVHASFEVPKACNQAKGVENDHRHPPAPLSIGKYCFLPPRDMRFGMQDICLSQLHHSFHLCEGTTALGWEGPTANCWPTSLSGEKHDGTLAGHGATGLIHRCRGLHGHSTFYIYIYSNALYNNNA